MPKVTVTVPHHSDPDKVVEMAARVVEKTIQDFQGHDLTVTWSGRNADFQFKSMAFTIRGRMTVEEQQVVVEIDLPFAAMMFKDSVEKAVRKNMTRAIEQA
jgi:hypothetical protein